MPLATTSALTVTPAERDRVNAQVSDLTTALATANARIVQLEAELALRPPLVPTKPGLYVDGAKLRCRNGNEVQLRGMELMLGQDALNRGMAQVIADIKALGCNAISPLFETWFVNGVKTFDSGSVAQVKAFCDAARSAGLIVGVNGDHRTQGAPPPGVQTARQWLCQPEMVALLNGYSHVFLELEVETDPVTNGPAGDAAWVAGANSLVAELRAAGHVHPVKVGAPQGGRRVEYPLRAGAQVLAADPLKNVLFTFQAYWPESTTAGQWYQQQAGVVAGLAGTKAALGQCAASGLCFVPGLDWQDDIGTTGAVALSQHCDSLGLSYQYWVYSHDGIQANNVIGHWNLLPANITANGTAITAALRVKGATLPAL